jgi:uncharacterized protein (DUF433 family)
MTTTYLHLDRKETGAMKIVGTRLRVYTILGDYEMGYSPEYIAEESNVPLAAVFEALAYAYDHPEEMEAIRQADEAAGEWIDSQLPEHLRKEAERVKESDRREMQELIRKTREARLGPPVS